MNYVSTVKVVCLLPASVRLHDLATFANRDTSKTQGCERDVAYQDRDETEIDVSKTRLETVSRLYSFVIRVRQDRDETDRLRRPAVSRDQDVQKQNTSQDRLDRDVRDRDYPWQRPRQI